MHAARLTIGINYAAKWEAINRDQLENCINWKLPSNGTSREAGAERPFQSRQITIKITFDPKTIYTHRRELRLRLSYRQSENCGRNHNYEALIAGASRACRIVSSFDLLLFYLRISLCTPRASVCVCVCVDLFPANCQLGECLRLFYCSISYQWSSKQATQGEQTLRPGTALGLGLGAVLGSGDIIISVDKLCLCFVLACLAVRVPCSA